MRRVQSELQRVTQLNCMLGVHQGDLDILTSSTRDTLDGNYGYTYCTSHPANPFMGKIDMLSAEVRQ